MKQKYLIVFLFSLIFLLFACNEHLITDKNQREEIKNKFHQRHNAFLHHRQRQLLDVFDSDLTLKEFEALEFLYAYESLSDLSNYDAEYYLQQVRYAFKAKETFPWGKRVSENDFLHFVLPPRAGTENLDSARQVIFHELKERLLHMSMKEAALEVNHWCHEKVTYAGTDSRTSAPLATIKNAKGRCGEESVLTVTALRAVGIPARQIYTPRWVHQDDNHAWVEFWADGQWYFMGACEPEADVNQGWFVEPTRRAILTATQTLGHYSGSDVIYTRENFTRLNQIENYATAKNIYVKVVDAENMPLHEAEVSFMVCNYAELYNLATLKTNEDGICKMKLGLGDVLVWVNMQDRFSFEKVSVASTDTCIITLDQSDFTERVMDIDLVPPVKKEPLMVSAEGKRSNQKRLAYEDSIRLAYEQTFATREMARRFAIDENLDTTEVWQKMKASRGNWKEIKKVWEQAPEDRKELVLTMLNAVSKKDLRDAPAEILLSHLKNTCPFEGQCTESDYVQYVLNPRIASEKLSAYKAYLKPKFVEAFWWALQNDPSKAEQWILKHIKIDKTENYIHVPAIPQGAFEMEMADLESAQILFVAMCRTAGVVSRIDKVTKIAQYKKQDTWINVYLGEEQAPQKEEFGTIQLLETESTKHGCYYYKQFTLAKFENGRYRTLQYDFKRSLNDFPEKLSLATGNYMLYTAEREKNGTLLTKMSFFSLAKDEHKKVLVGLRKEEKPLSSLGNFNLPPSLLSMDGEEINNCTCSPNKGIALIWLDPDKEPSKHVLKDFEDLKQSFDALGMPFVFVLPNDERAKVFNKNNYNLPENALYMKNEELLLRFEKATQQSYENKLPVLTMLSANGDILFLSTGYRIGTGDQLLKVMKKYKE